MNKIHELYYSQVTEHQQKIDDYLTELLPDNFEKDKLSFRHSVLVEGATTIYYNSEPIISLFPIEMKHKTEDNSVKFEITQKYITHTKD